MKFMSNIITHTSITTSLLYYLKHNYSYYYLLKIKNTVQNAHHTKFLHITFKQLDIQTKLYNKTKNDSLKYKF